MRPSIAGTVAENAPEKLLSGLCARGEDIAHARSPGVGARLTADRHRAVRALVLIDHGGRV
jgi:hypothetical protein